jgi:hypothetical protein
MWRVLVGVALFSGLLVSSWASAATVNTIQGQVLINRGQGYKLVAGSTEAEPGATVVANPGSSAQVVYPDGCTVTVEPGSIYTIAPESSCGPSGGFKFSTSTLVVGGIAVAGAGAAVLLIALKAASP